MTTKAPTKSPAPPRSTKTSESRTTAQSSTPESKRERSSSPKSEHPAAQGIPYPTDPSAVRLQEEQDELQQPGRVARGLADQIDNDPGYSKDQLAHMREYWSHGDAVGEDETPDDDE